MTNKEKLSFSRRQIATIILCFMLFGIGSMNAKSVSSRVIDPDGKPVEGASISDGKKQARSKADGSFTIQTEADSLIISRIGFHKRKISTFKTPNPVVLQVSEIVMPLVRVVAIEQRSNTPALDTQLIFPDTNGKPVTASDFLLSSSSFSSTDTKLWGERQTVSLLGNLSRHTVVLLDGIPLNTAGEAFDFSKIPVSQIEYIEIIKGTSSVYGGSAAIGGVVNIHTLSRSDKPEISAQVGNTMGSFGMWKQAYSASISQNAYYIGAEYSHHNARNNFAYETPDWWGLEGDKYRYHNKKYADSFFLKSSLNLPHNDIEYTMNWNSFVRELPGPINFLDLYDDSVLLGENRYHNLRYKGDFGSFAPEMYLWLHKDDSSFENEGSTNPIAANSYRQSQTSYGARGLLRYSIANSIVEAGAEATRQDYSFLRKALGGSLGGSLDGERPNHALSLRAEQKLYLHFVDYKISAAARRDFSSIEDQSTWRLEQSLSRSYFADFTMGFSLGTAFSLPSLYDMYWIGDSETQGNPNLMSEKSKGMGLWASAEHPVFDLRASYHANDIDELIQYRQVYLFGAIWKPFNIGKAEIRNWEFEANLKPLKFLSLSGSYTLTDAKDISLKADGTPSATYDKLLSYTPQNRMQATFKLADETKGLHLRYNHTGEQYSTADNLIEPLPAFDTLDAGAFFKLRIHDVELLLDMKLNNLLNKEYEIYAYIPQPGFNWSLGTSISYKIR